MKVTFRTNFARDVKRIRKQGIKTRVQQAIDDVKQAVRWTDIPHIKKLADSPDAYRIRVGNYRIGVRIVGDTVDFVRVLARSDIYRRFP
ncbi:MAG: type II toxin-antitoxin system RelE/ParE family toxin [Pirellulales bacterium]